MSAFDPSSRLPSVNRIPGRDRQFLDDYAPCHNANTEEVYLAYGDTVVLLKKVKIPYREVDTAGANRTRPSGKFGGRRVQRPHEHNSPQGEGTDYGRPDEDSRVEIPAIVDTNPTQERRDMLGLKNDDEGAVSFSRKWLEDRGISIDPAEDHIEYKDSLYRLAVPNYRGNFLNSYTDITYTISGVR